MEGSSPRLRAAIDWSHTGHSIEQWGGDSPSALQIARVYVPLTQIVIPETIHETHDCSFDNITVEIRKYALIYPRPVVGSVVHMPVQSRPSAHNASRALLFEPHVL